MEDQWPDEIRRLEERMAERRAKTKEQSEKTEAMIREAEERRRSDKPPE